MVWAIRHWPALLQAHCATSWIAWWSLATVAARVIMAAVAVVIAVAREPGRACPDGPAAGVRTPQVRE
ncbi:unnamed protein product [[Actinomadura] parvosata subsp. kistnae]|uniref:Uncharacterized protein n=1 Tax=[Actinomadura] parvosata subsp. kistnae TaxID=1909395 RepID=A0A1U9ZZ16_9ACTN|nr:hypothetical protein [Nonomuraea sp. ATCC 55076]AQZ63192.1 hypothetical protein BKM31_18535 [Nonomuraea sp. ATCC 55076]SPL98852.1 unnamed protein product [Actinomadura parvosata subsp. kistnae]